MLETWVQSLGWEDSPEKKTVTHASILARRIPWTVSPWVAKSWIQLSDLKKKYLAEILALSKYSAKDNYSYTYVKTIF